MNLDDKELSDLASDEPSDTSFSGDKQVAVGLDPEQLVVNQLSHQVDIDGTSLYPSVPQLVLQQYGGYTIEPNPDAAPSVEQGTTEIKRDARGRKRSRPISTAPKRNLSAYMFFANCHRPYVRKIYPEVNTPDITRILGRMWMDASKEEKKIYEELAEKDKERYHNEKKLQQMLPRDVDDEGDRKPRKKRLKKDPTAPKRNSSAYIFYSNEKRHELKRNNPELSFSDIAKILSKQWKNASAEDRRPYEEMARSDKHRYFSQKKEYDDHHKVKALPAPEQPLQIAPGEVNLALSQLAQYNPLIFQTLMNSAGLKDMFNLPAEDPNNVSYNAQLAEAQQHNLAVSSTSLMMPSFALNMSNGGNSLNQSIDLDSNGLNLSSNNLNINNVLYDT
jgi:hypothetical protein